MPGYPPGTPDPVLGLAKTHHGFLRYRQHPESHTLRRVATIVFYQGDPGAGGQGQPGIQRLLHPGFFPQGGLGIPNSGSGLGWRRRSGRSGGPASGKPLREGILGVSAQGLVKVSQSPDRKPFTAGGEVVQAHFARRGGGGPLLYLLLVIQKKGDKARPPGLGSSAGLNVLPSGIYLI